MGAPAIEEQERPQVPEKSGIFRIFSNDYGIPLKQEFCRLLQEGDLEKALKVIKKISPSTEIEPSNKIEAIVTLVEGYRALAQKAAAVIGKPDEELMAYRQLGTPAEISAERKALKKYQDVDSIEEVKKLVENLRKFYETFNTPEDADAANKRLSLYEAMGEPEDLKSISELAKTLSDIRI